MKVRFCLVALCFLIFHCSAAYGQTPKKDDRSAEWEYKQLSNPYDELLNHYAKLDFVHFVMTALRAVITKWTKSAKYVKSA